MVRKRHLGNPANARAQRPVAPLSPPTALRGLHSRSSLRDDGPYGRELAIENLAMLAEDHRAFFTEDSPVEHHLAV